MSRDPLGPGAAASTRRAFVVGAAGSAAALWVGCATGGDAHRGEPVQPSRRPARHDPGTPPPSSSTPFAEIEQRLGGRLGVAAIDTGSGARLGHRGSERFAMCSTFKTLLAGFVLSRVDRGELSLDKVLPYAASDVLGYAPVAKARLAEGALSVEIACAAIVEVSDNTAANLLLRETGGPAALTAFLRTLGDATTRLDREEPTLNTNLPGDPRDTTTPDAMGDTVRALTLGEHVLKPESRQHLSQWLERCSTGLTRLRAGIPAGWRVGDKTGTGANGAANDVAIVWPPGRAPIVLASYVDAPGATPEQRNAAHADVARGVVSAME